MRLKSRAVGDVVFESSSGNVFADAGLPDAEEMLVKSTLIYEMNQTIKDRGLTQTQVAELLGIGQPDLSRLLRGRRWGYSVDRLLRFLAALDEEVRITIKPKRPNAAPIEIAYSCAGDGEPCHMAIV
jgi:predicted XRE-type DNA-binding protein